ncbi:hypothetical protein [Corynebacterium freneyi]|uniref:Uncharacterized protein YfeS n=1 Tax=Corynebacterium freneyi TaxID=134034 RepID=A0ABS4U8Z4_9CORY|nr:hypothetical protein [Corynebacterium freneyi]MBP2332786.1 uncharacterized protein YfeS [Corynebacterium freneyi]QXA53075.1 hypothetical protein I6L56_01260 [Corynebacterium freneyi]UBI03258.1 hypothetical protein LA334_05585 [Corynebacterium freneyi]WJZ05109.1 hypothetical protein CFREN_05675 [Corynebacterium freneyi]
MSIHVTNPDEGLSPRTSHPRFVELAPEGFYSEIDEFAPFGNDSGADVLVVLEELAESDGDGVDALDALHELLSDWDFGIDPELFGAGDDDVRAWVAQNPAEVHALAAEAQARIAAAIGWVKITGTADERLLRVGEQGARVLGILDPGEHREDHLAAVAEIREFLAAAAS